ncbi:MAG: mercuric transporter MerT family protein [Gemmatimonadota bacterium]
MKRLFDLGSGIAGGGAALASVAASVCCLGPVAIAVLGVQGAILAAGIKPFRTPLLAGSFALLALAFWGAYRRPAARPGRPVEGAPACRIGARRTTRIVLWVAAALWVGAVLIQFLVNLTWLEGVS